MDTETTADRVVRFAHETGLTLMPWQEWVLRTALDTPQAMRIDTTRKPLTSTNAQRSRG